MEKGIGLQKGFVRVEKYNPKWKEEFNKEKKNLKKFSIFRCSLSGN